MVVNENGLCQTQRNFPELALIQPSIHPDFISLSAPGMPLLQIYYQQPTKGENITVTIWSDKVVCTEETQEVSAWFNTYLNQKGLKLVRISFDYKRTLDPKYTDEFPGSKSVALSDEYPILLCTTESQKAVSDYSKQGPIPMTRFRPNIVVEGTESAFCEDLWKTITIGDNMVFHPVRLCARCKLTKVDQTTGKVEGPDPLITLGDIHQKGGQKLFGQNLIFEKEGSVSVGDSVKIVEFWEEART
eukprot:TRINITY_DN2616_c0_g1_i2.p1 TRINITY_DN2616_c0_g1~~TRINITY_DN2616_c0_g1_i2.p1  ORF type:complete len:245 (-),score=40.69 TRINITY_DN2616_c0_g1_i2:98-832(-)